MPTPPGFSRLQCHFGEKTGHVMVENHQRCLHALVGLLQRAIPGAVYGALGAR